MRRSTMSHHENGAEHVHDLIKDQRTAILTTVHDESGKLTARPMACQQADPDGTLWFLAFVDSEKTGEIRRRPDVNVAFTEAWFQCEPEDPRVAVIRVDGESAEYWDSPGKVGQLVGVLKAKVTGARPDDGENETVRL